MDAYLSSITENKIKELSARQIKFNKYNYNGIPWKLLQKSSQNFLTVLFQTSWFCTSASVAMATPRGARTHFPRVGGRAAFYIMWTSCPSAHYHIHAHAANIHPLNTVRNKGYLRKNITLIKLQFFKVIIYFFPKCECKRFLSLSSPVVPLCW